MPGDKVKVTGAADAISVSEAGDMLQLDDLDVSRGQLIQSHCMEESNST